MNISIIFVTYKRPEVLEKTLTAFCSLGMDGLIWEILIIDVGRDEYTQKVILSFSAILPIKHICMNDRRKSVALNHAASIARGEIFVLCDDDVLPCPGWVKEIWAGVKRWPMYSVFAGKILLENEECIPRKFKKLPNYHVIYGLATAGQPEGPCDASNVYGANMAIRREIFENGWRYNENLGPAAVIPMGEDTDFVLRLQNVGFQAVILPSACVYHQIRPEQTTRNWLYQRAFNLGRSSAFFEKEKKYVRVFSIPRFLFRLWISYFFRFMGSHFLLNSAKIIFWGYKWSYVQGQIYEYRRTDRMAKANV